jgi:hypothetical protein
MQAADMNQKKPCLNQMRKVVSHQYIYYNIYMNPKIKTLPAKPAIATVSKTNSKPYKQTMLKSTKMRNLASHSYVIF